MSRIGKKPIQITDSVKLDITDEEIKATGPKGSLSIKNHHEINIEVKDGSVLVSPKRKLPKKLKGLWGLYRVLVFNIIEGVQNGFEKKLEIEGVGFRAAVEGNELVLNLGFVNPVKIKKPEGIEFSVEKNVIVVSGINKELVGQTAAVIRASKKAEPYKGKGIKYEGEKIRRKEGKKVVSSK